MYTRNCYFNMLLSSAVLCGEWIVFFVTGFDIDYLKDFNIPLSDWWLPVLGCQFLKPLAQTFIHATAMLKKGHHAASLNHSIISITTVLFHCSMAMNDYFFPNSETLIIIIMCWINFIIWFCWCNHHLYQFTQMPGNFYRRALFQRTAVVSFTFSNLIVVLFCIGLSVGVTIAILILLYYQVQFIILGIANLMEEIIADKILIRSVYNQRFLHLKFLNPSWLLIPGERNIDKQNTNWNMDSRKGLCYKRDQWSIFLFIFKLLTSVQFYKNPKHHFYSNFSSSYQLSIP